MEMNNKNDMPVFIDNDLEPYTLLHDIICNWWVIVLGGNCRCSADLCSCEQPICSGIYNTGDICGSVQR